MNKAMAVVVYILGSVLWFLIPGINIGNSSILILSTLYAVMKYNKEDE